MDHSQLQSLVRELVALPNETEWVEFKHNKVIPDEIGEYVSALANSAALHGKSCAYVLWGVDDETRQIVGTTFHPRELKVGGKGYAIGFEGAIDYINDQLPHNEQIGQALRSEVHMYPEIAVRELVANALIHQDFSVSGAGPMVEIFEDRMEISNPGVPLIDTLRFIDEPPRSRNEMLAAMMRRMNVCEERGSGIDKVIFQVELFQLPAPDFRIAGDSTISILYGPRKFNQMERAERIRACYQHACLQYVSGKRMSNSTLRKRMGIEDRNYPQASWIIKDTVDTKLIRAYGEEAGAKRDATYVPFWA